MATYSQGISTALRTEDVPCVDLHRLRQAKASSTASIRKSAPSWCTSSMMPSSSHFLGAASFASSVCTLRAGSAVSADGSHAPTVRVPAAPSTVWATGSHAASACTFASLPSSSRRTTAPFAVATGFGESSTDRAARRSKTNFHQSRKACGGPRMPS